MKNECHSLTDGKLKYQGHREEQFYDPERKAEEIMVLDLYRCKNCGETVELPRNPESTSFE